MKTVFITGTSSGLGQLTAIHFARQGWNVAATMRNPQPDPALDAFENVRTFELDVTDVSQVKQAVSQAIDAFGQIDVVVNNAGAGAYGPLELAAEETIDSQFLVNVRGPINVIRGVLPHFRSRRAGLFINISSFMGVTTAVPAGSLYNMSKFALEGLTEGLYYELKPFGIELRLIEQGGSRGNRFLKNMTLKSSTTVQDYAPLVDRMKAMFESVPQDLLDDPQTIVDEIHALATGRNKQFRTLVGPQSKQLMAMRSSMPIEEYLEKMAAQWS